jgi:hypothetical protein
LPSFKEALSVAAYNGGNGGSPAEAIRLLEARFQCGVCCALIPPGAIPLIDDVWRISVVLTFTTSHLGWQNVARGALLDRPTGAQERRAHAVLIEGYDTEEKVYLAKNSWGYQSGDAGRFRFRFEALHYAKAYKVYFTRDSIRGKTSRTYRPQMRRFQLELDGRLIQYAYMDEFTARHETNFICWPFPTGPDGLNWIGCDGTQYLGIILPDRPRKELDSNSQWGLKEVLSCLGAAGLAIVGFCIVVHSRTH